MKTTFVAIAWGSCLLLALVCLAGCGGGETGTALSTDFARSKPLFAAVARADKLVLYEGLPHDGNEKALFDAEKRGKPTVEFYEFLFYRDPLEIAAGDADRLRLLLGAGGSFKAWRGFKKCGGFHPDYLAEWRVGDADYRMLICLGCSEVKVYAPDRTVYCNIAPEAHAAIKELLGAYRKNRPEARQE